MLWVCHESIVISKRASMMSISRVLVIAFNSLSVFYSSGILHRWSCTVHDSVHRWRTSWIGQEQEHRPASHTTDDTKRCWSVTTRKDRPKKLCHLERAKWSGYISRDSQVLWGWPRVFLSLLHQKPWLDPWRDDRGPFSVQCISPGLVSMRRSCWQCYSLVSTCGETQVGFFRNRDNKVVEHHQNKNLPHTGQQRDAIIVPTACFVAFVFEKSYNDCILKVIWHYLFFPYASQDAVECIQSLRSNNHEDFSRRPSIPDALTMLVCLITFLTSSKKRGRSRSSLIALWGVKSSAVGSTVVGLLRRLEKCSLHYSMILPLSLSKVMLPEAQGHSAGIWGTMHSPQRAEKLFEVTAVSKLLDFLCLIVPSTVLYFLEFPLGFAVQEFEIDFLWLWCHIILPFYKGTVFFFQ